MPAKHFTTLVESLCERARQGKFAAEIVDECVVVAALNTTESEKYLLAEFDARLLVLNAFIDPHNRGNSDDIVKRLDQIEFINWLEGFASIVLIPVLIRPISTRTFLDLMFGRVILLSYFDPSRFLAMCKTSGLRAGFVSTKKTNRLRTAQGWKVHEYPIFNGRALGYITGGHPFVLGSARIHQMAFNWVHPSSLIQEITGVASQMEQITSGLKRGEYGFTEDDLED